MVKNKNIFFLKFYDITEMNCVDIDEISNKTPTIVEYVGFLHDETDEIYRMKNFHDRCTSDILVIPKALVIEKKKVVIK